MTGTPVPRQFLPFADRRTEDAALTMFCLPFAGGGASVYRDWVLGFRPEIDVQPVQLPGREGLSRFSAVDDSADLVGLLGPALSDAIDRSFVLFGHSMGALLAAELAAWFERGHGPRPVLLVVSGRDGRKPGSLDSGPRSEPDDDEIVRRVVEDGADPEPFADPELRDLLVPVLRNDFRLCARYRPTFRSLSVPILALGGREDRATTGEALHSWRSRTSRRCRTVLFPGGHFYFQENAAALRNVIVEEFLVARLGAGSLTPWRVDW